MPRPAIAGALGTSVNFPTDMNSWAALSMLADGGGLTDEGRQAARAGVDQLHHLLGPTWLRRQRAAFGGLPNELIAFATHAAALPQFLSLVIRLSESSADPTFAAVRSGLNRGLELSGWKHLLLQLEVARLGRATRLTAEFEPHIPNTDRRADVVLRGPQLRQPLVVETTTLFQSDGDREHWSREDVVHQTLLSIEHRHGVFIHADLTAHGGADVNAQWLQRIEYTARAVREDGKARTVVDEPGTVLISPELLSAPSVSGVPLRGDGWRRLARTMRGKGQQTVGVPAAWIRIDALDGLFQFTAWSNLPAAQRVDVLAAAVRNVFDGAPHVAGLVISSGSATSPGAAPATEDTRVDTDAGTAVRRVVYPHVMRETFIIPLRSDVEASAEAWAVGYAGEDAWLDGDLKRAGFAPLSRLWH